MTDLCNPYIFETFQNVEMAFFALIIFLAILSLIVDGQSSDKPEQPLGPPDKRYDDPHKIDDGWRW